MNQSTSTTATRARFVVANRPARKNPGPCWAIIDRLERKVCRRMVYRASADQLAVELNEKHGPIEANPRDSWPAWTDSGRWTLASPLVAPAEADDVDPVDAQDRRDWAAMSNQDDADQHDDVLLGELDPMLCAYHDRLEAEWLARVPEQEIAEFRR